MKHRYQMAIIVAVTFPLAVIATHHREPEPTPIQFDPPTTTTTTTTIDA